ncbi:peptidylprolyl isomerase [Allosphingosinicella flava]|uniref:Parvulin-like PPIase n=1 Tax=Allosphingosinicella flava TaxID=2771430 RepID=A0A7T2LMZ2_9SPHN|nr:peptidylprolyl isomerase [Sphingosinicella flava]QPQ55657.1 peptidylprolyl isomerase [Sphingosinicella flava]
MMKLARFRGAALMLTGSLLAAAALAQNAPQSPAPSNLDIPANPQFFGDADPSVRKATALVNNEIITGTDIDHRMALVLMANQGRQISPQDMQRLRAQTLRNLVDESLQIQAAQAAEIEVKDADINRYYERYAASMQQTGEQMSRYLAANGSSAASVKRQIKAEIAWTRLQGREIEPFVNVSEDEVRAIIDRLNASKGQTEYSVSEIYLPATPQTEAQVQEQANALAAQIAQGAASFEVAANRLSQASTAARGGDLGWVKADQLPAELTEAVRSLPVGQISRPIKVAGGYSIIRVSDSRQVLTSDPRDATLSLLQLSLAFPAGTTRDQASGKVAQLAQATQSMGGCGGAAAAAQRLGAELVSNDTTRVRDLPPALQDMILKLDIGQATTPFGSVEDGVRVLVLCGRDDPEQAATPSFDQVYAQLNEQRVNLRAQRYLRDLRRDAVVEYR